MVGLICRYRTCGNEAGFVSARSWTWSVEKRAFLMHTFTERLTVFSVMVQSLTGMYQPCSYSMDTIPEELECHLGQYELQHSQEEHVILQLAT